MKTLVKFPLVVWLQRNDVLGSVHYIGIYAFAHATPAQFRICCCCWQTRKKIRIFCLVSLIFIYYTSPSLCMKFRRGNESLLFGSGSSSTRGDGGSSNNNGNDRTNAQDNKTLFCAVAAFAALSL